MLWNALAYSSDYSWFRDNIAWLNAATVIGSLAVGGLFAGFLGRRGALAGAMNGLTMFGGLLAIYVVLGVDAKLPLANLDPGTRLVANTPSGSFWPTFVAFSVGLAVAVIGGLAGAFIPRPSQYDDDIVIDVRKSNPNLAPAPPEEFVDN